MAKANKISASVAAAIKYAASVRDTITGQASAEDALAAVRGQQVPTLARSLDGITVTQPQWDTEWADVVREAMVKTGKYAADSVGPMLNKFKIFAIAYTAGTKPQDGESLHNYCTRVLPSEKAAGRIISKNKGGKTAADLTKPKADKGTLVNRDAALRVLANNSLPDMQVLDFLTKYHFDKLRAVYAELAPKADAAKVETK